jgi:hypothetical protein
MRRRSKYVERSFAHLYDTGGMRRTHLRGHTNILKRLLIHASGFNLGLVLRHLIGFGTPRGLQGRLAVVIATLLMLLARSDVVWSRAARGIDVSQRGAVSAQRPCSLSTRQRRRLVPRAVSEAAPQTDE